VLFFVKCYNHCTRQRLPLPNATLDKVMIDPFLFVCIPSKQTNISSTSHIHHRYHITYITDATYSQVSSQISQVSSKISQVSSQTSQKSHAFQNSSQNSQIVTQISSQTSSVCHKHVLVPSSKEHQQGG
jgi:hypothetical protein